MKCLSVIFILLVFSCDSKKEKGSENIPLNRNDSIEKIVALKDIRGLVPDSIADYVEVLHARIFELEGQAKQKKLCFKFVCKARNINSS